MLDDLPHSLVRGLASFVRARQHEKMPVTRNGVIVKDAMEKWKDWVQQQDWPSVLVRSRKASIRQAQSPKMSPASGKGKNRPVAVSTSPPLTLSGEKRTQVPSTPPSAPIREETGDGNDEIFDMDGIPPMSLSTPTLGLGLQTPPPPLPPRPSLTSAKKSDSGSPWKVQAAASSKYVTEIYRLKTSSDNFFSKSSLRSIMAEAETEGQTQVQGPSSPARTPERPRTHLPHENNLRAPIASMSPSISTMPIPAIANRPLPQPGEPGRGTPPRMVSFDLPPGAPTLSTPPKSNVPALSGPSGLQAQRPKPTPQTSQAALGKGKALMGPTFTPTRQQAPSHSSTHATPMNRRVSYVFTFSL